MGLYSVLIVDVKAGEIYSRDEFEEYARLIKKHKNKNTFEVYYGIENSRARVDLDVVLREIKKFNKFIIKVNNGIQIKEVK